MASLMDSLSQSLTPETASTIGDALGLEPQMVQQGVNVVGPLVQGGLANSTSNPQGLDSLMQMLTPPVTGSPAAADGVGDIGGLLNSLDGPDTLDNIMGMVTGQGGSGGASDVIGPFLTALFGSGAMAAINAKLDKALGFRVSPLIPLVTPLILSLLRKTTQEQKLDATGVADLLQQGEREFMASGTKEVTLVQEVMQAGQAAVALKSNFTPEEWMKIRLAPMVAAALVMEAAPSGAVGMAQETGAGLKALANSRSAADPTSLLNIAFDSPFSEAEKEMFNTKVPREQLIATLREGAGIIAAKDPTEIAVYRHAVLSVAIAVAEATKEGGLFGFGSARVNKSEKYVLDEIAVIFGA